MSNPTQTQLTPGCATRWRRGFGLAAVVLVGTLLATGCHQTAPPKKDMVVEVVTTTPITDDVTDYEDFTGRMDALKTVDIRPRVSGYINEAPFNEGDLVQKDQTLFEIDSRTYRADYNQAVANLRQAKAEVQLQTKRAERGRQLIGQSAIGPEEYEQIVALRDKAIASIGAMEAAVDRAKLYLDFTTVKVPSLGRDDKGNELQGRISRRLVDPGNLVNADQTILTTLVSINPMYAYFDVDERTYLKLAPAMSAGTNSWFSTRKLPVLMKVANEEHFTHKGYVNFLDNRLNANTGTVRMRGVFDDPTGVLKPGLFVRIRLPRGVPQEELLIPDEALLNDQGRKYVFVVTKGKNDKGEEVDQAEYRPVELGQSIQGLRVIKKAEMDGDHVKVGLLKDERVIISGMQRVRAKSVVKVTEQPPPAPPKSPLTQVLKENAATLDVTKPAPPVPNLKDMPRIGGKPEAHQEGKGQR